MSFIVSSNLLLAKFVIMLRDIFFYHLYISLFLTFPVKEFEYGHLYRSLEQLANVEKCANSRVVESGMLRGLNIGDIKRTGELLKLHDECKEFFQKVVKKKEVLNVDLHILSYCWCADLIRSAFSSGKVLSWFYYFLEL